MIEKPTVLILGAGASMDYGFPSGAQLLAQVLRQIEYWNQPHITSEQFEARNHMMADLGVDKGRIKELEKLINSTPVESIDELLEKRTEFVPEGKYFISHVLIDREQPGNVNPVKQRESSWYQYLWRYISTENAEDLALNKLSVITYNYDRSFEFFLRQAVTGLYHVSDAEAAKLLDNIRVIHLHGQLGALPVEGKAAGRVYNGDRTIETVRQAMKGIRIIHESEEYWRIPEFQRATQLLESAEEIVVLGFGYHPINIKRLGLGKFELMGTTYGLRGAEVNKLKVMLPKLSGTDMKIYDFLRISAMAWS